MIEDLNFDHNHFKVNFAAINCGKLRRYFSWENFVDFFRIIIGIFQSLRKIRQFRPQVIFCKGGYVSFPVAVAGWMCHIPVILHESDVIPGLANKLLAKFAQVVCVSFEESKQYFKNKQQVIVTGNPLREEITQGSADTGYKITGFHKNLPVLLVMGGSLGATFINELLLEILPDLLQNFQIIHIAGKGKQQSSNKLIESQPHSKQLDERYCSFEYVGENLKHFYAMANLIISRAGANSLAEIAAIEKPAIIIPLSLKASRGDQIINAEIFQKNHLSIVLDQEKTSAADLLKNIHKLYQLSQHNQNKFRKTKKENAVTLISKLILQYENRR